MAKEVMIIQVDMLNLGIIRELLGCFDDLNRAVENMLNQGYYVTFETTDTLEKIRKTLKNPYDDDEWIWE